MLAMKSTLLVVAFFRQAHNTPSIFLLMPSSSKKSQNRKRIAVSPPVQDFRSIVSRIVFPTSSGEELGDSASKCFILVTPCSFGRMFHFAQMLKEMQFRHDVEICCIFLFQCFFFQFDILLGHLLASFQQSSSVITLHCFICLCQKSGKPVASKVMRQDSCPNICL